MVVVTRQTRHNLSASFASILLPSSPASVGIPSSTLFTSILLRSSPALVYRLLPSSPASFYHLFTSILLPSSPALVYRLHQHPSAVLTNILLSSSPASVYSLLPSPPASFTIFTSTGLPFSSALRKGPKVNKQNKVGCCPYQHKYCICSWGSTISTVGGITYFRNGCDPSMTTLLLLLFFRY